MAIKGIEGMSKQSCPSLNHLMDFVNHETLKIQIDMLFLSSLQSNFDHLEYQEKEDILKPEGRYYIRNCAYTSH